MRISPSITPRSRLLDPAKILKSFRITGLVAALACLIPLNEAHSQTTILSTQAGGGAFPADWTGVNNVTTNLIDRGTYWHLEPAVAGDLIITSNYDLSTYASITVNVNVATFGSGANNALKIEYSTDGGSSWNPTSFVTATPTSSTYIAGGPVTITATFSATTKLRFSPSGTTGRGVRIQQLGITGIVGGSDSAAPIVESRSPGVAATGVALTPSISLTFDENIAAGTGAVRLFKENGVTDTAIPISAVTITGNIASFTPTSPLETSANYYVIVDAGAFVDLAAPTPNAFAGILTETDWTFSTASPDINPPVATFSPFAGETGVLVNTNLVITYDEPIAAGTGSISLYKTGGTLVQAFNVQTDATIASNKLTLNPTLLLEPSAEYYLEAPAGLVVDTSSNANPSAVITAPSDWSFSTRALPSVVINQYYEGTGTFDRYIELKNLTSSPVSLSGYRITVWSNSAPSDNEGWKSGTATTDREVDFGSLTVVPTIEANSTLLIANIGAVGPAYAASSANLKSAAVDEATFFNGDDSVVLYFGATNDRANVVDAISLVGTEGTDTSFYRISDTPVFSYEIGSSISDDLGTAWQKIATTTVDAATPADAFYLQAYLQPQPPILSSFVIGKESATSVTPRVTLDYTSAEGSPTEFMVSESSDFTGASWVAMPGTSPVIELSAGAGTKTLYFKIRNAFGESSVLSDTIDRADFVNSSSVIFTQYYEGTSNNKYVEITNTSASSVDLSSWRLVRWGNAETENWKITAIASASASGVLTLNGTLLPGQTVVLSNSAAVAPISSGSAFISSSIINHTGNDSYGLYEGSVSPSNLRDALSFTVANEGGDKSFVRISSGLGFDFNVGTSISTYPAVWALTTNAIVDAATSNQKEFLGTYLESAVEDYGFWINTFFAGITDPLIIGFSADPDKDGIPNGIEALIGGNPNSAGVFKTSGISQSGSTFIFFYPQAKTVPVGITAAYEWSTDLSNWQSSGASFGGLTVTLTGELWDNTDPAADLYRVSAQVTAGAATRIFVRVLAND
jgi:hypothetical protein